jgi:hypothetical protein
MYCGCDENLATSEGLCRLKTLQQAAMKRAAVKGKISFLALGE